MPSMTVARGNELFDTLVYNSAVTFPTLGANASGSNTVTMNGVLANDFIGWNMQNPPAHLVLDNAYVSAANTITLLWSSDATGITGATVAVIFNICRCENGSIGTAGFPTSLL